MYTTFPIAGRSVGRRDMILRTKPKLCTSLFRPFFYSFALSLFVMLAFVPCLTLTASSEKILIDTNNLDTTSRRATSRDVEIAAQLSDRISWRPPPSLAGTTESDKNNRKHVEQTQVCLSGYSPDPQSSPIAMFEALRDAKFDARFWQQLSVQDALRYDYKQFVPRFSVKTHGGERGVKSGTDHPQASPPQQLEFGMSSVLCRLETLVGKQGGSVTLETMREFAQARGLDCLIIMSFTLDGRGSGDGESKVRRELLLYVPDNKGRFGGIKTFLEGSAGEVLQLRESKSLWKTDEENSSILGKKGEGVGQGRGLGFVAQWEMENVRPSRKQVAPIVTSFYESMG